MSEQEKQRIINSITETEIIPHIKQIQDNITQDINIPSITKAINDLFNTIKYMNTITSLELSYIIKDITEFRQHYQTKLLQIINNRTIDLKAQPDATNSVLKFIHSDASTKDQKKCMLLFTSIQIISFFCLSYICFSVSNKSVPRDLIAISLKEFVQSQPWILANLNPISKLLSFTPSQSLDSKNELQDFILADLNNSQFMKSIIATQPNEQAFSIQKIQLIFLQQLLIQVGISGIQSSAQFASSSTKTYFMKHCSLAIISPFIIVKKLYIGNKVPLLFAISEDKQLVFYPYQKIEEFKKTTPQPSKQADSRKYPYGGFFPLGGFKF